jgi:hypothetical protein
VATPAQQPGGAVGADDAVVDREGPAGLDRLLDRGDQPGPVVGVHELQEVGAGMLRPGSLEPEDPLELVRPVERVGADLPLPAPDAGDRLGLGELLAPVGQQVSARLELLLGSLPPRELADLLAD